MPLHSNNENSYHFQTSCYLMRISMMREVIAREVEFLELAPVGDWPLQLFLSTKGDLCFINKLMSCYRRNVVGSWSSRIKRDQSVKINYRRRMIEALESFNRYTEGEFSDLVKKEILFHEFHLHLLEGNSNALLEKQYRDLYKAKLSHVERMYYFLDAKAPFVIKLYNEYAKNHKQKTKSAN